MGDAVYSADVLVYFVAYIGRLFYSDNAVVILDYIARAQRAVSEAELLQLLNWKESYAVQVLHFLERQLMLERIIDSAKGTKVYCSWRIPSYLYKAVAWRHDTVLAELAEEIEQNKNNENLFCAQCNFEVPLLEAASAELAEDDGAPLCSACRGRLRNFASEENALKAKKKYDRVYKQFERVRRLLERVANMAVPEFTEEKYEPAPEPAQWPREAAAQAVLAPQAAAAEAPSAETPAWFSDIIGAKSERAAAAAPARPAEAAQPAPSRSQPQPLLNLTQLSSAPEAANDAALAAQSMAARQAAHQPLRISLNLGPSTDGESQVSTFSKKRAKGANAELPKRARLI